MTTLYYCFNIKCFFLHFLSDGTVSYKGSLRLERLKRQGPQKNFDLAYIAI